MPVSQSCLQGPAPPPGPPHFLCPLAYSLTRLASPGPPPITDSAPLPPLLLLSPLLSPFLLSCHLSSPSPHLPPFSLPSPLPHSPLSLPPPSPSPYLLFLLSLLIPPAPPPTHTHTFPVHSFCAVTPAVLYLSPLVFRPFQHKSHACCFPLPKLGPFPQARVGLHLFRLSLILNLCLFSAGQPGPLGRLDCCAGLPYSLLHCSGRLLPSPSHACPQRANWLLHFLAFYLFSTSATIRWHRSSVPMYSLCLE
jgi:hypothetical protein